MGQPRRARVRRVVGWIATAAVATVLVVAPEHDGATRTTDGEHGGPGEHASGHDMPGMVQPTPAAYQPQDRPLDPDGWTATAAGDAGAEGTSYSAADEVLDGDDATAWRAAGPDETTVTLDLGAPRAVSSLTYLAPADGEGGITEFAVATSRDGSEWTTVSEGRWLRTRSPQPTEFAVAAVRFVRLTALTVAHDELPAAAEITLAAPLGQAQAPPSGPVPGGPRSRAEGSPSSAGSWGKTIRFPLIPVAVALLPGNRLLAWSAFANNHYEPQGEGRTQTAVLDLDDRRVRARRVSNTGHDMFCPGVAMLADGRLMVTGGSNATETSIYNPYSNRWTKGPAMNIGRGYHAMTLMPDGRAFTVGGSWGNEAGLTTSKNGEVWSPRRGWRALPGVRPDKMLTNDAAGIFRQDNHMWLFPVSRDQVLQMGPSRKMNLISLRGRGSVRTVAKRPGIDQMNGNAVMYGANKVLVLGGAANYDQSPSTGHAFTIDISGRRPRIRRTGNLNEPRSFANSVVLPNGEVVAVGGQEVPLPFNDQGASYRPEIWNPRTGRWRLGPPMAVPRNYHSVAILLPDGRVFTGGGGLCPRQGDRECQSNHPNGQIYTPGYLLNPDGSLRDRPQITGNRYRFKPGSKVVVRTDRKVRSFSIVRMAEATHSVDNDQRRVPLRILRRQGHRYTLQVPRATVALPGNYMLFAMDGRGTPSRSQLVNVPVP